MMKNRSFTKLLAIIVCAALITAMALSCTGCGSKEQTKGTPFRVVVTDLEGEEQTFDYVSDKKTVGEALLAEGLIDGEDGPYGLYIKTVNGLTLDWDKDGKYWAFYINGEYATTGVDTTDIEENTVYGLKAE